ncbi:MAG: endonuclease/exonuclease/phosphatase family protein [Solirubrobacteraceae bacterium MAG38_C4-C5]|nr:endonuclease/exonuclease/phosphatase family protein [Candidatus Siliceabacter maunaloa]
MPAPFAVRPRHTLALLAALALLAVALLPSGAGAEPRAPDRELSVMSYNIHVGIGEDDRLDLQRIADEIRASGAEVAGLQEVDRHWAARSDFVDQAQWLAEELDMHVVYGANLDRDPLSPGEPRRQYGTAILSDHPILSSRNTLLPRPEGGEQRGLLEAVINVRGVRVRIANTHLQHNSAVERAAQVERIMELLADSEEPVVLTGDLNAVPGSPEIAPLSERYDDAWLEGGEGDGFTFSAANPDRRIDYIFVSPQIDVESAEVVDTLASDHLPLVAELELPGRLVGSQGSRAATEREGAGS